MAVMDRVVKFFEEEHAEVFDLDADSPQSQPLRLTLFHQDNCSTSNRRSGGGFRFPIALVDLHEYIQAAFGWENYHLHQFEIDGAIQPTGPGRRFRYGLRGRGRTFS